jgi:hypothetical protein
VQSVPIATTDVGSNPANYVIKVVSDMWQVIFSPDLNFQCHMSVFFVFGGWEVFVCFVNIAGIVDHRCYFILNLKLFLLWAFSNIYKGLRHISLPAYILFKTHFLWKVITMLLVNFWVQYFYKTAYKNTKIHNGMYIKIQIKIKLSWQKK